MRRGLLGITFSMFLGAASGHPQGAGTRPGQFTRAAPANPKIDMSEEPSCKTKTPNAVDPVVVVNKGGLANVFIYVKTGLPAGGKYAAPTTPVVLDQSGCLYHPRVVAAMVNQPIEIRNSD